MATPRTSIDDLPIASLPLSPADGLIVQQSGVTKHTTVADLLADLTARVEALEAGTP